VPTFEESGVPGMIVANWFGVFGPAKLPKDILDKLHDNLLQSVQSPDVQAKLTSLSLDISTNTPEEFKTYVRMEVQKWGRVVKAAGIMPE
jgi:tripartite-type tricarboxylate transporter receptor subunit TctC